MTYYRPFLATVVASDPHGRSLAATALVFSCPECSLSYRSLIDSDNVACQINASIYLIVGYVSHTDSPSRMITIDLRGSRLEIFLTQQRKWRVVVRIVGTPFDTRLCFT